MPVGAKHALLAATRAEYATHLLRIYNQFGAKKADEAQAELKSRVFHPANSRPFEERNFMKARYEKLVNAKENADVVYTQ